MVTSAHLKSHFKFKQNLRRTDVLCSLTSEVRKKDQEPNEVHYVNLKMAPKALTHSYFIHLFYSFMLAFRQEW